MNTIKRVEHDLRPHNAETIKRILEFYEQSNKCCAIQATGTGKTFLILRLLEIFNDEGKTAVIFAPNREIIRQTKGRMKKFSLDNAVFYTYQKLAKMTDDEIKSINADLIVCDELHRIGAKTWGAKFEGLVETHPQAKVFGVTATPLRCADGRDMSEEYFDNNKACDISLAEALVREIIPVMPLYVSALFTFEEEYENMREKIKNSDNSNEEKAELQKALLVAKQQMEKAKGVPQIIKKYITNYNGKYIVFCKDKKHLYEMKDVVIGWFREAGYTGEIFEYPYYSNSSEVKRNLDNFEANKEEGLKLLFVIDKLNEGLHLDEIHGCILLRTTVSNIVYYQQIGRAIDAGSDEQRVILDLVSNFNSLKSFNFKKELENKIVERCEGKFAECSEEFEVDKFNVVDLVQECVDVFNEIDSQLIGGCWLKEDVEILRIKYHDMGVRVQKILKGFHSKASIVGKAHRLGLCSNNLWSKEEDAIILEHYKTLGRGVVHLLPNKTIPAIESRASKLNVRRTNAWSTTEDEILRKFYPAEGNKAFTRIPNRTKYACLGRVRYLKLSRMIESWTIEEVEIIKQHYPNIGGEVVKYLPRYTKQQIQGKARHLGVAFNKNCLYPERFLRLLKEMQNGLHKDLFCEDGVCLKTDISDFLEINAKKLSSILESKRVIEYCATRAISTQGRKIIFNSHIN